MYKRGRDGLIENAPVETEPSNGAGPPWFALAYSGIGVFGIGWGGMVLFGYHLGMAGLADSPVWLAILAFIAMPVGGLLIGFVVGDGSVIEVGIKSVVAGLAFWMLAGRSGWLDPILLGIGCGVAAMVITGVSARLLGIEDGADGAAAED